MEVEMTEGQTDHGSRIVYAPAASGADASASVISVVLNEGEEVKWCWTHFPDGSSAVTGYEIVKVESKESVNS
jgi:hypothetical protein